MITFDYYWHSNLGLESFKFICLEENRFLFYGPTRAMVRALRWNNKLSTFCPKPYFIGFLICVIDGFGVPFGHVENLLEFIPHHMTILSVYMWVDFQASYNFERSKRSTCISLWQWPLCQRYRSVIFKVLCTFTSTIILNLRKMEHWPNVNICIQF